MKRLLPLILIVVAFAGCGSDSSTSSGSSTSSASGDTSLTKAEFIAEADAICEASKAKQESLRADVARMAEKAREEEDASGTVSDATRKDLAESLDQVAADAEAGFSDVQSLGPAEADASQLETIFETTESAFAASHAYAAALKNHEDAKAQAVAESGNADTRDVAGLAQQYGFKVCFSAP